MSEKVASSAFYLCKFLGLKIRLCRFFNKYHVCIHHVTDDRTDCPIVHAIFRFCLKDYWLSSDDYHMLLIISVEHQLYEAHVPLDIILMSNLHIQDLSKTPKLQELWQNLSFVLRNTFWQTWIGHKWWSWYSSLLGQWSATIYEQNDSVYQYYCAII